MSKAFASRVMFTSVQGRRSDFSPLASRLTCGTDECEPKETTLDAYQRGCAEGRRIAEAECEKDREALLQLLAASRALKPEPSEELAAMIALTVEHLVTELVMSAPIDRAWLEGRIAAATACIDAADAARTLWLHPDDINLLEGFATELDLCADVLMERGALRVACSSGWIEDSRSIHLNRLRDALGTGPRK